MTENNTSLCKSETLGFMFPVTSPDRGKARGIYGALASSLGRLDNELPGKLYITNFLFPEQRKPKNYK